jgi:cell division initiation protein
MKITPLDIQQQQFRIRFRGFDIREVDAFLEQLTDAFKSLEWENQNRHEEIRRLKLEIEEFKAREDALKRAMVNSQKVFDQLRENARKSAEIIMADAEVKAEKILNRAHNRLAQLHEDIAELKRQRVQIEIQIRSILEGHTRLLELGQDEAKRLDEEDGKVKVLKHIK